MPQTMNIKQTREVDGTSHKLCKTQAWTPAPGGLCSLRMKRKVGKLGKFGYFKNLVTMALYVFWSLRHFTRTLQARTFSEGLALLLLSLNPNGWRAVFSLELGPKHFGETSCWRIRNLETHTSPLMSFWFHNPRIQWAEANTLAVKCCTRLGWLCSAKHCPK